MAEQISPEAEAVRVAGLVLAQELGHTIVGWGDKPAPAPNTQRMTVAVLSAALPHLRDQIGRQLREQIADYGDRCGEEVSRRGEAQPCDKTAVAARYDPREEFAGEPPYAVCAYHARGRMVPLSELLRGQ